ncbi:unnamed protein product [Trichogramma brassicae]|uniref:SAP domain-containing protein n=1 Tax=Trichogramma brassicae TaxID=86971 RepID=A0A6H5J1U7_9HYME|nr:unnamed protein product [Trichogramma brassicae]
MENLNLKNQIMNIMINLLNESEDFHYIFDKNKQYYGDRRSSFQTRVQYLVEENFDQKISDFVKSTTDQKAQLPLSTSEKLSEGSGVRRRSFQTGASRMDEIQGTKLEEMTVVQLRAELKQRKLKTTGNKEDLIARVKAALALDQERDDDVDSQDESDLNESMRSAASGRRALQFADVEACILPFSGDDHGGIRKWLKDFEGIVEESDWSDVQKVTYAKRLLTGSVRLFAKFEVIHS